MKKIGLSLITVVMLVAFVPYDLIEGAETEKVTVSVAKTMENWQLRREAESVKNSMSQINGRVAWVSAGGVLIFAMLIIILLKTN